MNDFEWFMNQMETSANHDTSWREVYRLFGPIIDDITLILQEAQNLGIADFSQRYLGSTLRLLKSLIKIEREVANGKEFDIEEYYFLITDAIDSLFTKIEILYELEVMKQEIVSQTLKMLPVEFRNIIVKHIESKVKPLETDFDMRHQANIQFGRLPAGQIIKDPEELERYIRTNESETLSSAREKYIQEFREVRLTMRAEQERINAKAKELLEMINLKWI